MVIAVVKYLFVFLVVTDEIHLIPHRNTHFEHTVILLLRCCFILANLQ